MTQISSKMTEIGHPSFPSSQDQMSLLFFGDSKSQGYCMAEFEVSEQFERQDVRDVSILLTQ